MTRSTCVRLHASFYMRPLGEKNRDSFGSFESSPETTKSASANGHPAGKQCTGEETIRLRRRSWAWRKEVHMRLHMRLWLHSFAPFESNLKMLPNAEKSEENHEQSDRS